MKTILLFVLTILSFHLHALNIRIIESTSANPGHTMDTQWQSVATSMGHTPTISPQTTLDNTTFFASSDVLIISSGVIALTAPRIANIQAFAATGKPVYIQAEYLNTYTANGAFQTIVNALGGGFTWGGTTAGTLAPMSVLGTFATTPLAAPSLSYFWYGCLGNAGANVTPFLTFGGLNYGFVFCPPSVGVGTIITTSDQDWVRSGTSPALMQNIIHHLINGTACSPLPLTDVTLSAMHQGTDAVSIAWNCIPEQPGIWYHLERSKDQGKTWAELTAEPGTSAMKYFTDVPSLPGRELMYRVRLTAPDGLEYMSRISTISMFAADGAISVFPSPVPAGEDMVVSLATDMEDISGLMVMDINGRVVYQTEIHPGSSSTVVNTSTMVPGVYFLILKGAGRKIEQRFSVF